MATAVNWLSHRDDICRWRNIELSGWEAVPRRTQLIDPRLVLKRSGQSVADCHRRPLTECHSVLNLDGTRLRESVLLANSGFMF